MLPSESRPTPDSRTQTPSLLCHANRESRGRVFVVSATCPEGGRYTRVMTASPIPDDILAHNTHILAIDRTKNFGVFQVVKGVFPLCNELLPAGRSYRLDGKLTGKNKNSLFFFLQFFTTARKNNFNFVTF